MERGVPPKQIPREEHRRQRQHQLLQPTGRHHDLKHGHQHTTLFRDQHRQVDFLNFDTVTFGEIIFYQYCNYSFHIDPIRI